KNELVYQHTASVLTESANHLISRKQQRAGKTMAQILFLLSVFKRVGNGHHEMAKLVSKIEALTISRSAGVTDNDSILAIINQGAEPIEPFVCIKANDFDAILFKYFSEV